MLYQVQTRTHNRSSGLLFRNEFTLTIPHQNQLSISRWENTKNKKGSLCIDVFWENYYILTMPSFYKLILIWGNEWIRVFIKWAMNSIILTMVFLHDSTQSSVILIFTRPTYVVTSRFLFCLQYRKGKVVEALQCLRRRYSSGGASHNYCWESFTSRNNRMSAKLAWNFCPQLFFVLKLRSTLQEKVKFQGLNQNRKETSVRGNTKESVFFNKWR